jgi:very-short-patch-repair endonuclease
MSIILQPAGNKDGREHYLDTVSKSVSISSVAHLLGNEELDSLKKIYPSGEFRCWGVTPSKVNKGKWDKINVGDVTLFSKKGGVFATAITTFKSHNQALALHLWKTNSEGNTWEYMYFVDDVSHKEIPYQVLNALLGYKPNFIIQGFNIITGTVSDSVLSELNLLSSTFLPPVTREDAESAILNLEATERIVSSNARLEQSWLRRQLFSNNTIFDCACCKKRLNVDLLVTAHIKPRKDCSREEKLESKIVFPLCKLGCDELFEKGVLVVVDGKFQFNDSQRLTKDVKEHALKLDGQVCDYYDKDTEKYFKHHASRN